MLDGASDSVKGVSVDNTDLSSNDLEIFNKVVSALKQLDQEGRERMIESVITFLGMTTRSPKKISSDRVEIGSSKEAGGYSENRSISPKEFMLEKEPRTDVERIACLAYYLAHYRDMPHFKTLDLSTLNTEAAQLKFSNAAFATENASKMGYLVPASKGQKQLSAFGERFVRALPDREAAKDVMSLARPRRKERRQNSKQSDKNNADENVSN